MRFRPPPSAKVVPNGPSPRRSGAALVVALGVLSLVLLLATAFVLSMQTEGLAIRNSSEKTDARGYADIAIVIAAAYMEPETDRPDVFLTPHAYWRADEESDGDDGNEPDGEIETDSKPLRRVYDGHSLLEVEADVQGLLVGSDGTEIGGREVHLGGTEAPFADFPPSVTNFLPPSLAYQLSTNALSVRWQYITSVNQNNTNDLRLTGRVAFFAADLSGLADIRHATTNQLAMAGLAGASGDEPPSFANAVSPIDLAAMLEAAAGSGGGPADISPLDTFTTRSLDPDPWCLPIGTAAENNMFVGHALAPSTLTNKFDLAALTNGAVIVREAVPSLDRPGLWRDAADASPDLRDALDAVSNALFRVEPLFGHDDSASNRTARAVFWNLLNDLDADRYPQTDTDEPWLDDVGIEALPLVSEFDFFADPDGGVPAGLPYTDDCPACAALREANESATNVAHRVGTELWYPFFCTNGLPAETHVALHLWKTAYTNDVQSALDRVTDNLGSVTETLIAHWGTNVYSRSYRIPRGSRLEFPNTAIHTLQYGVNDDLGAYVAAGILPEGENPAFVPDLEVPSDVTLGIDTNAPALTATSASTDAPLHLLDILLEGPLASLFAGEWSLDYTTTTNAVEEPDTEMPADPVVEYTTTFTFLPDDPDLIDDLLAAFSAEEPEELEDPDAPEAPETQAEQEQPEEQEAPEEPEDDGGSGTEPPVVVPAPPTLTLPVTFQATTNAFGETTAVLATTPDSDALRRIEPFIPRLLRGGDAAVTSATNTPSDDGQTNSVSYTRYELSVWYEVVRNGPETIHGSEGLLESTGADMLSDASCVLKLLEEDFVDGFACVTNKTPFYFEAACVHSAFDTNGVLLAQHTVTNLLPIGLAAVTNVAYAQNPESTTVYESGAAFDWSAVATDFTSTNLVADILNTLHFSAQLYLEGDNPEDAEGRPYAPDVVPYDEAPGPGSEAARGESAGETEDSSGEASSPVEDSGATPPSACEAPPWLLETPKLLSLAVDDPRFNGHTYEWYDVEEATPGEPPVRFPGEEDEEEFFSVYPRFAGYPVLHHDGLPAAVGDIGLLGTDEPWETLDLFSAPGTKLLDLWSLNAPATNEDRRVFGRIHACTPFPGAAALLFADTVFGTNRLALAGVADSSGESGEDPLSFADALGEESVASDALDLFTNAVCAVGWTFSPQPTNSLALIGDAGAEPPSVAEESGLDTIFPFTQWMDALAPHLVDLPETLRLPTAGSEDAEPPSFAGVLHTGLDFAEDFVRDLPDRVTFRQNLLLVIARGDSLAPNGRVFATSWTAILLWRDAWTGRWTILGQQELR